MLILDYDAKCIIDYIYISSFSYGKYHIKNLLYFVFVFYR